MKTEQLSKRVIAYSVGVFGILIACVYFAIGKLNSHYHQLVLDDQAKVLARATQNLVTTGSLERIHMSEIVGKGRPVPSLHYSVDCPNEYIYSDGNFTLVHSSGQRVYYCAETGRRLTKVEIVEADLHQVGYVFVTDENQSI